MRTYRGQKTMKSEMREYLIKNKELSTEVAERLGWTKLTGYIFEFRREGMNIQTDITNKNNTIYRLVEDGLQIIDSEKQENQKQEYELQPEDMRIKTSMKEVILDHLKKHKNITSAIAMKKYKCLNLSAIIKKLKDEGWNISRTETRGNNDYNIASNRNNAYSIYTLENKSRIKTVYKTTYICQVVAEKSIPEMVDTHESKMKAMGELNRVTDLMVQDLNLFYGNSLVEFIKVVDTDSIMVVKKETIKKLFKKKYETMMLAKFTINEEEVEV